jgi:hypothetical protein
VGARHLDAQRVLAARRHLADDHRPGHAGGGAEQDGPDVLGRHGPARGGRCRAAGPGEGVGAGHDPLGHGGHGDGAHGGQPVAGHELDEVAPVRADVGEGPRRTGQRRVDAPVVVVLGGQPVLQVAAVDQAQRPDPAGGHPGPGLAHERVEAVDERHGGHDAGGLGRGLQLAGGGAVDGQRLLAHDVLAGGQRRPRQRRVQVVGRADVDHVDVVGHRQRIGVVARPLGAQPLGGGLGAGTGRGGDRHEPGARPAGGVGVDRADEAGAGDGDAQLPVVVHG